MMEYRWLFIWSVLYTSIQVYSALDEASFYGGSFISIPLKEAKSSTDIHFKFRTHLPNALILIVAGSTDYCIVQLENSRLKISINLGAGDSELLTSHNIKLNDFKWHSVFIVRKEANLSVVIDNLYTESKRLPGNFFELNIHYGLFVGGHRNSSDLFFGHQQSFRGCMSEVMYNGMLVLDQARRRQSQAIVHGVTWNCAAEFESGVEKAISFVEDDNFMIIPHVHTSSHSLKLQFELKTLTEHSILIYNTGPPTKQDHFAVEIWKGKIRVLLKHADKIVDAINDEYIANGHWHRVSIRVTTSSLELSVGSTVKNTKLIRGLSVDYSDILYVGGIELMKRSRAITKGLKTADSSYKGCLKSISIGDKLKGLPNVLVSEGLLAGCMWQYPCLKKPCEDNAQCIQEGLDSFYCKCQEENCISSNFSDGYRVFSRTNQATDMELLSLKSLDVLEGQNVLITPANLHVILDYPKYGIKDIGIKFTIITSPMHGSITIDVWPNEKNSFTLYDISRDKVHYVHDGSESENDKMDLEVEFFASETFILPAYLQGKFKFTLSVNITSVNDPPVLNIPTTNVLRIAQGTKMLITKDLLRVSDPDSTSKQLVLNIIDAGPGHFEYKTKANVPVTSFTLQNVEHEQIFFVHHSNSNASFITMKISDGIETSKSAKLRVSTYPQFWRLGNNTGLILMHHTSTLITPYNLSFVSNVANSTDNAQFRIVQGPQFGLIEIEKDVGIWESALIFVSDDIRQHRVRYRHVTSTPEYDEFQFRTTLNMSMLYTFRMTFAKCNLMKINSNVLNLGPNLENAITASILDYQTSPVRSETTSIRYVIMKPSKYGYLFSAVSKYVMRQEDSFTQEDISSKYVKYKLHRKAYSSIYDIIQFVVMAPGCKNVTGNLTVVHEPSQQIKSNVNVVLKPIQVEEGAAHKITKSVLNIEYSDITDLVFNVTKSPLHGILQVLYDSAIRNATSYFTMKELHDGQLNYIHDDSETEQDQFDFMALSSEEENFEYANTFKIDVLLQNDNEPVRIIDKIFHVVVGGQKYITGDDLRYEDKDLGTKDIDIIYTCREISNGDIYNSKNEYENITTFTQADLNNNMVLFKHKGSEYGKMKFSIHDGHFYSVGVLEIQASAPFIHVANNKKLIVEHGKSAPITTQHLLYTTNLFATDDDIIYEIVNKPSSGRITSNSKEVNEFTNSHLLKEKIYYLHNGGSVSADEINLRVRCQDAVTTVQLGVWILPASYWKPLIVRNLRTLTVEETTSALISKSIVEVSQPDVPANAITYHISEFPINGYVSILPAAPNGEDQSSNVRSFTQSLMNDNRVIYVQSIANETSDQIVFNVTNGMVWLHDLTLDIQIIPERLYLGSNVLTVNEGGVAALTLTHLYVLTEYYKSRVSDYVILEKPKHGCIQVHRKCNKHNGFSHKDFAVGAVHYANDGSENSDDEITLVAVAGQKRSIPLTISIRILPLNNQKPKLINNTGMILWEGGSAVITNAMLAAIDADMPKETLFYTVIDSSFGNLYLKTNPNVTIHSFTQESIDKGLLLFKHRNGSDAKFRFNVSDGLHTTKEHTFYVKAKSVSLKLIHIRPLHIFPFQKKFLTTQNILSCVSDVNRPIEYEIVNPPVIGRLMTESESSGIFKMVNVFTQEDVNASKIFYEHIHEFEDLYTSDSFVFNVKSYLAQPILNQKLKIDISVYSGGLDAYVNVPKITVDEGGATTVPVNLSGVVSFLENHASIKSPVIHASAMQPKHGQIFLQNNPNLTTFTQPQLESGQVHYQHDHSDSLEDIIYFSLYLIPNYVMLCNVTVPVSINPINDQPFKLVTPAPHLTVVQGESYVLTKNDLSTEDADTPPKDLKYDIVSGPSKGLVILLPDKIHISHFTQLDINEKKLAYVHNSSILKDSFHMRVWDGKFKPEYIFFNVKVIPAYLNVSTGLPIYLQQGSNVVSLSEKQFVVDTNVHKRRILYELKENPKHGVIYVKDNPANQFSHEDLVDGSVMYMQTDMTTANDSFKIFVGITAGDTLIGNEISLIIKVQPLMQIGNFTVLTGDTNKITLHVLDATPLAKLTSSNPKYTVVHIPQYGQIRKIIRSSGERRNVLDTSVTTFTHEEIQSGLIYIVVKDIEVGWGGLQDRLGFILAASIFQPAQGELKISVRSALLNEIHSTLAGPSNPAGHEGGMHIASPNMTRDYFLIVSMVAGVIVLGVAVIIIIKCRSLEPEELNKEDQCLQPIPLPRPPDRLMSSSPPLKHVQDGYNSPVSTTLPHCKVTPLSRTDIDTHARYPYGVDEHSDDWSSCDASDPACPSRNNIMLRRNQYWV